MKRHLFWIFCAVISMTGGISHASDAYAATTTVCAAACDYTTITDAIAGGPSAGDVIAVGSTYASTTETFSFNLPTGVT